MTAGALELAAAYKYFPAGTIFVAVVDPGVGSARRGVAADTGDYRFVAPDNGVLTQVLRETPAKKIVELTERRYARPTVSRTFEGRDRFAPAAAWLAKGTQLSALGRPVTDIQQLDIPLPEAAADAVRGVVLRVDRFGNLVTNIDRKIGRAARAGRRDHHRRRRPAHRAPGRDLRRTAGRRRRRALRQHRSPRAGRARPSSAADRLGLARGAVVTESRARRPSPSIGPGTPSS